MRPITYCSILIVLILSMFLGCSTGGNNTQDVEAVRKVTCIDYATAVNNHDTAAYTNLFTDDVYWAPPNSPVCRSKDEIINNLEPRFEKFIFHIELTPVEIEVMGTFAYSIAEAAVTLKPRDGSPDIFLEAAAIYLLKKQADGWKIFRQVYNFSAPL